MAAEDQPTGLRQGPAVAVLALGAFATALNVTLLSPLLSGVAADFGVSTAAAGQLATATAVCAALTALIVAPWIDRFPRRVWLRAEGGLLAAGTLLSALAPSFAWLVVGRALAGVGGAVIFALCLAAAGDLFPAPAARNRVVGLVGTAATLGAVLGLPVLTQIAAVAGWRAAIAALLPAALLVAVGARWLPAAEIPLGPPGEGWAAGYRRVLAHAETRWLLGVMVIASLSWFGWLLYLGAYAERGFGVGANALSLLLLAAGGAEIAGNNLTPLLLRTHPARAVAIGAATLLAAALCLVGLGDRWWSSLLPFVVAASLTSVVLFTATSILLLDSQPAARGGVMALQSVCFEVGAAFGASGAGGALVLFGDFPAVYRALAASLPLAMLCLLLSARRAPAPVIPEPASAGTA